MWGVFLSEPLGIDDLVSRYLTNCLMPRMSIYNRYDLTHSLPLNSCESKGPWGISPVFTGLFPYYR